MERRCCNGRPAHRGEAARIERGDEPESERKCQVDAKHRATYGLPGRI